MCIVSLFMMVVCDKIIQSAISAYTYAG